MLDLINLLDEYTDMTGVCDGLAPVLRVVGIALKIIQYAVPILLIVIGGLDFAKATIGKDEKEIKEAQNKFIKRAIVAGVTFLIIPIVNVLMTIVSGEGYKDCMDCVTEPFSDTCKMKIPKS